MFTSRFKVAIIWEEGRVSEDGDNSAAVNRVEIFRIRTSPLVFPRQLDVIVRVEGSLASKTKACAIISLSNSWVFARHQIEIELQKVLHPCPICTQTFVYGRELLVGRNPTPPAYIP
jgi:hypothetical protein